MPILKNKARIFLHAGQEFDLTESIIPDISYKYEFRNFLDPQMIRIYTKEEINEMYRIAREADRRVDLEMQMNNVRDADGSQADSGGHYSIGVDSLINEQTHNVSKFIKETVKDILFTFADQGNTYRMKVEIAATFRSSDNYENEEFKRKSKPSEFRLFATPYLRFKKSSEYETNLNLHSELTYRLTDPEEYNKDRENAGKSNGVVDGSGGVGGDLGEIDAISHMTISLIKIFDYNTNSLSTRHTLTPSILNNYISFIPVNDDKLCILHCIYASINKIKGDKQFYNVKKYENEFLEWITETNLLEFYDEDRNFDLKKIDKLEDHLKININLYSKDGDNYELYYRSKYLYDEIVPIMLICYSEFRNYKHEVVFDRIKDKNHIPFGSKTFISSNSHAVLFRSTIQNTKKEAKSSYFCKYCDKGLDKSGVESHELKCRNYFKSASNIEERLYQFKDPKKTLEFDKFAALLKLPFVSYDFETRYDSRLKESVLLSYSFCFVNIFNLEKSFYLENKSYDLNEINSLLVSDILFISKYYYRLQNKDNHNNKTKCNIDECPLCHIKYEKYEYNHSHFENDEVNKEYDTFICKDCNKKLQVKNKPLQFYAFNAKNYDNTFLLHALMSSSRFKDSDYNFLAKSASKFTSIKLNISLQHHSAVEFKDAILHFPGQSLDNACKAMLKTEDDFKLLKIILEKKYGTDKLYTISKVKAPFSYEKLNDDNFDHIGNFTQEEYYNTLTKKSLSNEDYAKSNEVYLSLEKILNKEITFADYHDFYLLLDTSLLACLLLVYMNNSYEKTKINPLHFISSSSHAFSSFLYINHINRNPNIIKLPSNEVQLELKKAIHGGFTHVFNKKNDRNASSITTYVDATSLYPTAFRNYLPYAYVEEESPENFNKIMESNLETGKYWYLIISDIKALDEKYQHKVRNYPLFPCMTEVKEEWLSNDQIERVKYNNDLKKYKPQIKNTVTFFKKEKYYCSGRYLKNAIDLGYEVDKVHKIYKFKQSPVMRDYVENFYKIKREASLEIKRLTKLDGPDHVNTIKKLTQEDPIKNKDEIDRLTALDVAKALAPKYKSEIENLKVVKNFAKLLLNACYGSCLVDSMRFTEVEMVSNENIDRIQKLGSSFRFKDMLITENNTLIHKSPYKYSLNYPLMLGVAVLDDSKIQMSKYIMNFYDFITSKNLELLSCYADTDSYVSSVIQKDNNIVFKNKMEMFKEFNKVYNVIDMSWYTSDEYYCNKNEELLGMFTDETESEDAIINANFLCAKVYSMIGEGDINKLTSKGIDRNHMKKLCNYELYETIIDGSYNKEKKLTFEMKKIQNQKLLVKFIDLKKQYITYVDIKNYYGKNSSNYLIFGEKKHLQLQNLDNKVATTEIIDENEDV